MTGARRPAALPLTVGLTVGLVVAMLGLVGCTNSNQRQPHPTGTAVTRAPGQAAPAGTTLAEVAGLEPVQGWFAAGQGTPRLVLALSPT